MTLILVLLIVVLAAVLLQSNEPGEGFVALEKRLPIWKMEKDCLLSKKGDVTLAFRLKLPEIFTLSAGEYAALHQAWLKAIKVLPVGTVLHKQDWFIQRAYTGHPKGKPNFLMQRSDAFFTGREHATHECFLMLTLKATSRKPASSALTGLLQRNIVPTGSLNKERVTEFLEAAGQFARIISDSGLVTLGRVKEAELTGGENKPGLPERYLFLIERDHRPELKDIVFKPQWKIGENYCQLYSMADAEHLPGTCSPASAYEPYSTEKTRVNTGFAASVGMLLPINHIYNQFMVIQDAPQTGKRLEAKQRRLQSLSAYSRENAHGRDGIGEYLSELVSEGRTPVKAHFNILCWTPDREDVKSVRNHAASALAKMDITPHQETIGAPQLWWAGLPGNAADLPENDCFVTFAEQATCFLNMDAPYRSSKSPFGLRLGDRLSGVPVHVDISDEPIRRGIITNRNKIVVGGSGSGKSMFMNHLLHSYVQQGAHCVVVDVGHSYEGLCKLLDGYYFTYSEESPIRFNPFYISSGEGLDTEKKESIKTLLVALWKQSDEHFRRSEYVAISNALTGYYIYLSCMPTVFPCFDSFYEYLETEFARKLEADRVKDRDFDMANFLYTLRPFYKGGEFDYLLNARENLDVLTQPFIVFELDNIKDHPILFPIITLIIMELFIGKMRKLRGVRKVICIEEAWKAIAGSGMAGFMKYLYKTVRKHFGEAITVTQEIDDLIASPIIKEAIINNADCKIILDLKKFQNKFEDIQAVLGMTGKGRDLVLSLNRANEAGRKYREVYIELGGQLMKVYRYEPSPEELCAFSTEQADKLKVEEYTARHDGDIRKGLVALAAEMKGN